MFRRTCAALCLIVASWCVTGCDNGSSNAANNEAAEIIGKQGTIEFKPFLAADNKDVRKQRTGIIRHVNHDWVVVEENNIQIWVPKETVLEIRMGA